MAKTINEVGNRYGRLLVYRHAGSSEFGGAEWWCDCDCGGKILVKGSQLRLGFYTSCGYGKKERQEAYRAQRKVGKKAYDNFCFESATKKKGMHKA